jgi:hypothetical protein
VIDRVRERDRDHRADLRAALREQARHLRRPPVELAPGQRHVVAVLRCEHECERVGMGLGELGDASPERDGLLDAGRRHER